MEEVLVAGGMLDQPVIDLAGSDPDTVIDLGADAGVDRSAAAPPVDPRHVLLVGSTGGHLTHLVALQQWWGQHRRTWVTFDKPDALTTLADEVVVWAHHPSTRSIPNLIRNTFLAWRLLRRDRPDVIISTGAAVALPFFAFGRLRGIPAIYIEVYDRIDSASLTGRLCRPLASDVLIQWDEQRTFYPEGRLVGRLL